MKPFNFFFIFFTYRWINDVCVHYGYAIAKNTGEILEIY